MDDFETFDPAECCGALSWRSIRRPVRARDHAAASLWPGLRQAAGRWCSPIGRSREKARRVGLMPLPRPVRASTDRVVAEVNQSGDMVTATLRSVDAALPVTMVRATRGKYLRAEPVAALYEQGRVAHAGRFAELEDQMCDFGPDGLSSARSPDRLGALVWALTALLLEGHGEPRVRGI